MRHVRFVALASLMTAVGCGSSPTAPAPVLALSQNTALLSRTSTLQVTATSTQSAASTDVTSTATWRSSNTQVATVSAGLITAIGPGTATISAEHAGQTRNVVVTVRRRVFLRGEVAVRNLAGHSTVFGIEVRLDDRVIGGRGTSGYSPEFSSTFGTSTASMAVSAEPGSHQLEVRFGVGSLPAQPFSPNHAIEFSGPVTIVDVDTGEEVGTLQLETQQGSFGEGYTPGGAAVPATETWTVTVSAFTS